MDNLTTTVDDIDMERNKAFTLKEGIENRVRPTLSTVSGAFTGFVPTVLRHPASAIVLIGLFGSIFFVAKSYSVLEKKTDQRYKLLETQMIALVDRNGSASVKTGPVDNANFIADTPEFSASVQEKIEKIGSIYFSAEMDNVERRISETVTAKVDELKNEELKELISDVVKKETTIYLEQFIYETFTEDMISLREKVDEMSIPLNVLREKLDTVTSRVEEEVRAIIIEEKRAARYLERENHKQEELARKQAEQDMRRASISKALDEILQSD